MKLVKSILLGIAALGFSTTAYAQDSNAYVNLGVKTYEFDTYNLMARLGYNFSQNFGIEAEGSLGLIDNEIRTGVDLETQWDLGAYIVGRVPVSEKLDLFARAGYTSVNFHVEGTGVQTADFNADGFAVGGGLQYNISDLNGIRIGYTYNEADGIDADVIDLSFVRKF